MSDELHVTWDELNEAVFLAPVRVVERADGTKVSYRDTGEAVAAFVARKLGVRLVVERDDAVVTYEAVLRAEPEVWRAYDRLDRNSPGSVGPAFPTEWAAKGWAAASGDMERWAIERES